jgi:hypothetical protein
VIAMSLLVWRLYRAQAAVGVALLAAFAALLLVTGMQVAAQWHSALTACTASGTCGNLSGTLFLGSHEVGFLVIMTLGVPLMLGMLIGAPLVAHEFEAGTSLFAWTQSVTRRRWLAAKAGWLLLAAAAVGGVVSGLVTWWSSPDNALYGDAFSSSRFDLMGIVPVGYALFAVALGITAGALLRRTLPAIGITLAGYIAVRLLVDQWIRPHYMSAVTHVYGLTQAWAPAGAVWQISSGVVTPGGGMLTMQNGSDIAPNVSSNWVPPSCSSVGGANHPGAVLSCMQSAGYRQFLTFQPAGRYWAFQGIETGIYLAVAAALIAVAFVAVARRDA